MKKTAKIILALLSIAGLADAVYLTFEHFQNVIPPCRVNRWLPIASDCGKVLRSSYSVMFGVPLVLAGIVQYLFLLTAILLFIFNRKKIFAYWLIFQAMVGAIFSTYFMYIQIAILKSICIYCTLSALISLTIFIIVYKLSSRERFALRLNVIAFFYQKIFKPIFFLFDPEAIHEMMVGCGAFFGKTLIKNYFNWKMNYKSAKLSQKISGLNFDGPVGLSAGFDYDAKLTGILYSVGFGFQTAGTISSQPYEGNPPPRLGRLPKSKSLMVNKGFKNFGAENIVNKLRMVNFPIPFGISIGVSNNKNVTDDVRAVEDVVESFIVFEKNQIKNNYYELNISCPNLINNEVNFYKPELLKKLLISLKNLKLKKPVFVKMPIDQTDQHFLTILKTISQFDFIKGVIIGNLTKDRKNKLLDKEEVKKFKTGNFSGKPCEPRSNELIKLAYKKYKSRLVIIGCGGIFNGQDAYEKIKLGASLVQLITGMIFQGPQLISQINLELEDLLEKDGYKNIKEAIGKDNF